MIDGEEVIAPLLDVGRWADMKDAVRRRMVRVVLPCCGASGYLRTSKLGTRHFVHSRREDCDWPSETLDHLKAKEDILRGCLESGYQTTTEAQGEGWRADVLATKGRVKIALEVQLSAQTLEATRERQERYERSGVRGCWFFARMPTGYGRPTRDLPLFNLLMSRRDGFKVALPPGGPYDSAGSTPLRDFVRDLLCGRVRFCESLRAASKQSLRIVFVREDCWRCRKEFHIYHVTAPLRSRCGAEMDCQWDPWGDDWLAFRPEIVTVVRAFLTTPEVRRLKLGEIKPRRSETMGTEYTSFGCPWCDAIAGGWFVQESALDAEDEENAVYVLEREVELGAPPSIARAHWCYNPQDGCRTDCNGL